MTRIDEFFSDQRNFITFAMVATFVVTYVHMFVADYFASTPRGYKTQDYSANFGRFMLSLFAVVVWPLVWIGYVIYLICALPKLVTAVILWATDRDKTHDNQ